MALHGFFTFPFTLASSAAKHAATGAEKAELGEAFRLPHNAHY